jgi:hypothetical protein
VCLCILLKYVFYTYVVGIGVQKKPIRLTKHAVQRALKYDLSPELIEKIVWEGQRQQEGKTKTRYVFRAKGNVWVAICNEYPDQIIIITIVKGR